MNVQILSGGAAKLNGTYRRYAYRSVIPTALIAGILFPLLFIRIAFLAIEIGISICPTSSCLGWRFFKEGDGSSEFMKEWRRTGNEEMEIMLQSAPDSLDDLISEIRLMSLNGRIDVANFILTIKATLLKMEHKTALAKLRSTYYRHLASTSIPKPLHCLTLKLTEEYSINSMARSSLPESHHFSHLTNPSYLHVVIFTDNILAAHVAIQSTINSSSQSNKRLVFHVVTDKKTYFAMHAWFAMRPVYPAVLEVKSLHQFDCSVSTRNMIEETIQSAQLSYTKMKLLNYLKIHLPQFFPKLEKVILLDDDVIVQRDLSELCEVDLKGNVLGAIIDKTGEGRENTTFCVNQRLDYYLNFSNPDIFSSSRDLHEDQCAWNWGVNVFDLKAWRKTNITETYQFWLKKNREYRFKLWRKGSSLPPALIAFNRFVHPIDPSWIITGLGKNQPDPNLLKSNSVLHFNGPAKPWLEIAYPMPRHIWRTHLNGSDEFLIACGVVQ